MLTDTTIKRLDTLGILSKNGKRINGLFRLMENLTLWKQAYANIHANKGVTTKGSDGMSLDGFAEDRVLNLIKSLKKGQYRFKPVRRVYIPKSNGKQRPLGIPSGDDKLIQEVVRLLLEKIYEPVFQNSSHGFRPRKSCHTALLRIKEQWTSIKWIVSVDIKGFFDSIDHKVMLTLLKQKIDDEKFIKIIENMLKAGYLENWKFHGTYSGTPQGGVCSPILANIYLHELDLYVNKLRSEFNKGEKRSENKKYKNISGLIRNRMKKIDRLKLKHAQEDEIEKLLKIIKELDVQRKRLPSVNPFDSQYKRLFYCRYADDFLIGIIGSKEDSKGIFDKVANFVSEQLNLSVSKEKSKIVRAKEGVRFLGYDVKTYSGNKIVRTVRSGRKTTHRSTSERIQLHIPQEKLRNFCEKKGYGNYNICKSLHRNALQNSSDAEIVKTYNAELRGLALYYCLAVNAKRDMNKLHFIWQGSLFKTLAAKHKSTVYKIAKSLRQQEGYMLRVKQGKFLRDFKLFSLKELKIAPLTTSRVDNHPKTWAFTLGTTELMRRLEANQCEYCGKNGGYFEVHHIRKLNDIKEGRKLWQIMMSRRRRKTMVLCVDCHKSLHAGTLPNWNKDSVNEISGEPCKLKGLSTVRRGDDE